MSSHDDLRQYAFSSSCPRLSPEGHPRCFHDRVYHDINGVCSRCDVALAGFVRSCALPDTGEDPIWIYRRADIIIYRFEEKRPICGRLTCVEAGIVVLDAIERPAVFAQNGGELGREQIKRIVWLRDEWRMPR